MKNLPPIFQHPELIGNNYFLKGNKFPEYALLFIHGFTATTVEVRLIAKYFNDQGFTVCAPLLPGHGSTPRDLNRKSWKDWTRTVEDSYQNLLRNHKIVYSKEEDA